MHAIRKLRESGHATVADYEKLLAPNVVFHSPVLIRTVEGRAVRYEKVPIRVSGSWTTEEHY
jgi:hypothetical protein